MRNSSKLEQTFAGVMDLVFGDTSRIAAPSGSTIGRGRSKVDLALMLIRRNHWKSAIKETSIQLGYLASSCWVLSVLVTGGSYRLQCYCLLYCTFLWMRVTVCALAEAATAACSPAQPRL